MRRVNSRLARTQSDGFSSTTVIQATNMEQLWRQAGATSGNQSETLRGQKRHKQAKTVAMGCHRLPFGAHGKEGVNGGVGSSACRAKLGVDDGRAPELKETKSMARLSIDPLMSRTRSINGVGEPPRPRYPPR
jgi:hypothetical protein